MPHTAPQDHSPSPKINGTYHDGIITATSAEHLKASQEGLCDPHKTLHSHLTRVHHPSLLCPIDGEKANDVPYTGRDTADFNPGVARANVAATAAKPNGTTELHWSKKYKHLTPLQQHSTYWDRDNDGIISPWDTWIGFRRWGWGLILSLVGVFIIHSGLAWVTQPPGHWLPDPRFLIHLDYVHRAKHGSDSITYDNQGRFRPQNFEEFLANYDRDAKGGLSKSDLWDAWKGQRSAMDPFGWSAAFFEWLAVYLLLWPEDGILRKEDIRKVYDGSIFEIKAQEYEKKHGKVYF